MNRLHNGALGAAMALLLALAGCTACPPTDTPARQGALTVVATTSMLADLACVIGGEHAAVTGLMGPGVDPHLYQATAGNVALMQQADVVVYHGLHLEGKMGDVFAALAEQGRAIVCVAEGLDTAALLACDGGGALYDPHIWFDVSLWKAAAAIVAEGFARVDPAHAAGYEANLQAYLGELDALDAYIRARVAELPEEERVLITAHDAFHYFGRAYGFEVRALQGISTDAEAGTADVSALAGFIAKRRIRAIFTESSVPPKAIEALQAAVRAQGFSVAIGGELYSDSLGAAQSGAASYILTFQANVDTIVQALQGLE